MTAHSQQPHRPGGDITAVTTNMRHKLAALHPQVDWPAVLAGPAASVECAADALISVGCDPVAVKRFFLDETLDD